MIAACVLSDLSELLAYTTQSTMSRCEEYAAETLPAWERMKELGAKVVQIEIMTVEEADKLKCEISKQPIALPCPKCGKTSPVQHGLDGGWYDAECACEVRKELEESEAENDKVRKELKESEGEADRLKAALAESTTILQNILQRRGKLAEGGEECCIVAIRENAKLLGWERK
jgi:hypothetical protein